MHGFKVERFAMQLGWLSVVLKFPREHRGVVFVVAERLALGRLVFFAKMRAARFVALERVGAHQLGKLQEIGDPPGAFERLIEILAVTEDTNIAPKLLPKLRDLNERFA